MRTGADKTILKKLYIKTVAAAATLIMVITMTVSVTYAWMILSTSPTASGAQISLSGGNTILLAPDVTKTVGGVTVHYPGKFSDKADLSYDYLADVVGLTPVSTADGLRWIATGENGYVSDTTLQYANLTSYRSGGSYIYLDFWAVSPGTDYVLRVSTETGARFRNGTAATGGGSSIVEFPAVTENGSGFDVSAPSGTGAAASLRLGFLVNTSTPADTNLVQYIVSGNYDKRYKKLLGVYQSPGEALPSDITDYRFTIYEPNGTSHEGEDDGKYLITKPLINTSGDVADIRDILTVQTKSVWKFAGDETIGLPPLSEKFQTAVSSMTGDKNVNNVMGRFFSESLSWNVTPYIDSGRFFKKTASLYGAATDGAVSEEDIASLEKAGATDDVYITTLKAGVPQRIRLFIWLEGEDADCKNVSNGVTDFIINLELAGGDL